MGSLGMTLELAPAKEEQAVHSGEAYLSLGSL